MRGKNHVQRSPISLLQYTGDFFKKKTVNITDDVMLSSAYFYIHYCEEHVVSRDEGDAKRRIFPTAFKDEL